MHPPVRSPPLALAGLERICADCLTVAEARISLELDHNCGPRLLLHAHLYTLRLNPLQNQARNSQRSIHELVDFLPLLTHLLPELLQLSLCTGAVGSTTRFRLWALECFATTSF